MYQTVKEEEETDLEEHTYQAVCWMANGYDRSRPYVSVYEDDNIRVIAGVACRTGLTAPYYPNRAVYELLIKQRKLDDLFVYEDGEFIPTEEWYKRQRI